MKEHERNPAKHEFEVQSGSSHASAMLFVGNREGTAVRKAAELLADREQADQYGLAGETHVRLYHTYPSPGPVRRYVGVIKRDGVLRRAS
jgi:hypothetical protein